MECYQRTKEKRDRCPAKEYVIRTVKSVCDYCAHNKYAIKPEFRLEVEKFIQENKVSIAKQAARPKPKKGEWGRSCPWLIYPTFSLPGYCSLLPAVI